MAFMHRVSGWLGRLSVGRKLMLIYLLDLTAVIYVSGILIHEKYLAIDFARKEIVGTTYAAVVRDGFMGQFLPPGAAQQPAGGAPDVVQRLQQVRARHDALLRTGELGERFEDALGRLAAAEGAGAPATAASPSPLSFRNRHCEATFADGQPSSATQRPGRLSARAAGR